MIPESEKTADWMMDNADYISSQFGENDPDDDLAYNLHAGIRDDEQFNSLTKTYGIDYPEKVKHFPLVRPLLEQLSGEEWRRALRFGLHSQDIESIREKDEQRSREATRAIYEEIRREATERNGHFERNMDKLRTKYLKEYRSDKEIGAHKVMMSLIPKMRLRDKFNSQFRDQWITGKEFYQVRVIRKGQDPEFKVLDPRDVRWCGDDDIEWVNEASWAAYRESMSPTEIIDRYGDQLTKDEFDMLEEDLEQYHRAVKISRSEDLDTVSNAVVSSHTYDVLHCEWKSLRWANILKSKEGDEKIFSLLSDEELLELPKKRRKQVKRKIIQDRYRCTRIGDNIYVDMGRDRFPVRSISNPSKVKLTINGRVNRTRTSKPYSLIMATRDLQDLYDIMHFHKANLMALSGTKGMVMDMSQIPDFGQGEEGNIKLWLYYKKLGVAWIDRAKEGADQSFNQFASYDDTLGAGLNAVMVMIEHLEHMAHRIIGVNRQRLGMTAPTEGKAVSENAMIQSSINTEPIFKEHYMVVQEALNDILEAARISYSDGYVGNYSVGPNSTEAFTVDAGWALSDYGIVLDNLIDNERKIEELKALANQMVANQMLDIKDLLTIFTMDNLKEIQEELIDGYDRKQEEAMRQAEMAQEGAGDIESRKLELQAMEIQGKLEQGAQEIEIKRKAAEDEAQFKKESMKVKQEQLALEKLQIEVASRQGRGTNSNAAEVKNDI